LIAGILAPDSGRVVVGGEEMTALSEAGRDRLRARTVGKVAINGFMMPIDQNQEGSREFVLNGNFDMCGFGGPISINQWIVVKYLGAGRVPYTHLPMSVFGELEVGEEYRDGWLFSIYRMKAKAVSTPSRLIE
jgi:hypothetical protein